MHEYRRRKFIYFIQPLLFIINNIEVTNQEKTASILSEYGDVSIISPYILAEYGKQLLKIKPWKPFSIF